MNFPKILTLSITMNSWSLVAALWHDTTSCLGISNAKSRSYNIHVYNRQIDVKVDRHLSSATAEVPIKFQSDTIYKLQILRLQGLAYYYRIKKSYWICKRAPDNFSTSNNLYRRLYIYVYDIYMIYMIFDFPQSRTLSCELAVFQYCNLVAIYMAQVVVIQSLYYQ